MTHGVNFAGGRRNCKRLTGVFYFFSETFQILILSPQTLFGYNKLDVLFCDQNPQRKYFIFEQVQNQKLSAVSAKIASSLCILEIYGEFSEIRVKFFEWTFMHWLLGTLIQRLHLSQIFPQK